MKRFYVVVRADLAPGAVCAQSAHAVSAFAVLFPDAHRAWHSQNQNLIILAAPDENTLGALIRKATELGIPMTPFHEPDFGNELTACAFGDGIDKLVSSLPLALRTPKAA